MSSTDEFSAFTKKPNENVLYPRTAVSTVKKEYRRKFIDIKPIQLDEIKKELEEAEPVRLWQSRPPEEDLAEDEDEKSQDSNKENEENNFSMFETPAKPESSAKAIKSLNFQFVTPNNKAPPPRVQCSVNMNRYIRTPITRIMESTEVESDKIDLKPIAPSPLTLSSKLHKIQVKNDEYVVLNMLGKGGSSQVFHCFDIERKVHRAIKIVSLENSSSAAGFINEIHILQTLQKCNRIIKMFDYQHREQEKILLVVLEVGGVDLSKILKERALTTDHIPIYLLLYYWMEMLMAVKQIHDQGIIHADLKPANFLQVEGYLKLIDFGIATSTQSDMTSVLKTVPEGSFNYISPEAVKGEGSPDSMSPSKKPKYKIHKKSDVWSLGCILYQLVYRKTPFQHIGNIWAKLAAVVDPKQTIEYSKADWVPQKIIKTLQKCLQYNVKLRPTVDELIVEYQDFFYNL